MTPISSLKEGSKDLLKKLSCEYVILKMAEWHAQEMKFVTLEDFNQRNSLGITQLALYPFFTCIANGSFDKLYDLFSPYYALEDGPTSLLALNLLAGNRMLYFDLDDHTSYNLKVKDPLNRSWKNIEEDLKAAKLDLKNGANVTFGEICYDDTQKLVTTSVTSSIDAIRKQSNGRFILYEDYQIVTLARQHKSWSTIYNYYKNISSSNLNDFVIAKGEAEKDRKVYKPLEDLAATE